MPPAASTVLGRPVRGVPLEVDTFVGRRRELAEVRRLFGRAHLVTLAGPGGVGKTRLAVRTAAGMGRTFRDGVCFVDFGKLHDPDLMISFVAESLGMREQSEAFDEAALLETLRQLKLLLILDNCEHLVETVAVLADRLLHACPDLRILATSRESLGIGGEALLRVSPLSVPDRTHSETQSLAGYESVSLFAERALRAVPDFELTNENSEDVAEICRQLDGMPLALELATARLRTLSIQDLSSRLTRRYQVLTGGSRAAPERHKTLRLCVDWSYDQCTREEQTLWRRISVFAGGFELDAVEATCDFGGLSSKFTVLDLLTALLDKSIVTRVPTLANDVTRFHLLETLREYGMERLEDEHELEVLQVRHADWCRHLVVQSAEQLVGPNQIGILMRLDRELPNIRRALDHCTRGKGNCATAQLIAGSLHMYWISRGLLSEGRHWLGLALADEDVPPSHSQLQALFCLVALAGFQGDVDAVREAVDKSRAVASGIDDPAARAYLASVSGMLALFEGDLPRAARGLEEGAQGHREAGDLNREIETLIGFGLASALQGDLDAARASHRRVLSLTEPRKESWYRSYSLWALGLADLREGQHVEARRNLEQSLRLRRAMNDLLGSAWCIEGLALAASQEKPGERAATLFGMASALSSVAGTPTATFPDLVVMHDAGERATRDAMGDAAFDRAYLHGKGLGIEEAVAFALGERAPEEKPQPSSWSVLTPREREIAQLVAEGLTNQAIADTLVISVRTAETHVEHILTKLGFNVRSQIATWVAHSADS